MDFHPLARPLLALLTLLAWARAQASELAVELRIDAPPSADQHPLLLAGGIPFPRDSLAEVDHLRLTAGGRPLACQATKLAQWPDGSVKWALVETLAPGQTTALRLASVATAPPAVADPITATPQGQDIEITGGGFHAWIRRAGSGVIDALQIHGREFIHPGAPAALVVETLRVAPADGPPAFPTASTTCRDASALAEVSQVAIDALTVEAPGPLRATVLIRGHLVLPHLGATLPDQATAADPRGQLPFSMRVSFIAGSGLIVLQHQLIYTGEPDCDVITHWGIRLPGLHGAAGRLCLEPGIVATQHEDQVVLGLPHDRFCWAALSSGLALIRHGWENRPCGIRMSGEDAWLECWPSEGGEFDLRRYAREWSVGESGDTENPALMQHFATLAARGLAKSQELVLDLLANGNAGALAERARALSGRALLVAPPPWYAASGALGAISAEAAAGPSAELEAMTRRRLDYQLAAQDLFSWYGTLVYGFWQSRYGQTHRNDRWDCDYGRWGWGLGDGGGRVGHELMQEYLRTLDRRYLDAGEAWNRIVYDTDLVHTRMHLENAGGWWTAIGCCHRHNVQPFGCPYIGMRGAYPLGQRLLYLLTGDGVIRDGLELVSQAAQDYARGNFERLCDSGGSDGQGSAACALLWKFEVTGDAACLQDCKTILDKSALLPPKTVGDIGYGAAFGLYFAAAEYQALSGDAGMRDRLVSTAELAASASDDDARGLLQVLAVGVALSHEPALAKRLEAILAAIAASGSDGLDDQPPKTWPGHSGWKVPALEPNVLRDLPWAFAALGTPSVPGWPAPTPAALPPPVHAPADWYQPGGAQAVAEGPVPAAGLLGATVPSATAAVDTTMVAGQARWSFGPAGIVAADLGGARPLQGAATLWVEYLRHPPGSGSGAAIERVSASRWRFAREGAALVGCADGGDDHEATRFTLRASIRELEHVPVLQLDAACQGDGRAVVAWGLGLPLALGGDPHAREVTMPCRFRLERVRLDQNDERIPNWLTAEYKWGEGAPLWPLWRNAGIELLPGPSYRAWRANRADTSPVYCDQGFGGANWLDLTDRATAPRWGLSLRLVRAAQERAALRCDLEHGILEALFHSDVCPTPPAAGAAGSLFSGCVDLALHDGFRPPFSRPELTATQYAAFIHDLDYDENTGLTALRFRLSITHKVSGQEWWDRIRDLGIEPREILYQMQFAGALAVHCQRLQVPWDATDLEGSVQRILDHYRTH